MLTVSDGVVAGQREDLSGARVAEFLEGSGFDVVERRTCADGREMVAATLASMCSNFHGVVVTTGGTGFASRDETPEGTRSVIDREAPGLAEAMRSVNPLGRLSRGVAGVLGESIIVNTPGSPAGAVEQLGAVIDVLVHALALLAGRADPHPRASR